MEFRSKIANAHFLEWGYKRDKDDPHYLHPMPELLEPMMTILEHLRKGRCSLRQAEDWLFAKTKVKLSYKQLGEKLKLYKKDRDFINKDGRYSASRARKKEAENAS